MDDTWLQCRADAEAAAKLTVDPERADVLPLAMWLAHEAQHGERRKVATSDADKLRSPVQPLTWDALEEVATAIMKAHGAAELSSSLAATKQRMTGSVAL